MFLGFWENVRFRLKTVCYGYSGIGAGDNLRLTEPRVYGFGAV